MPKKRWRVRLRLTSIRQATALRDAGALAGCLEFCKSVGLVLPLWDSRTWLSALRKVVVKKNCQRRWIIRIQGMPFDQSPGGVFAEAVARQGRHLHFNKSRRL